MTNMGNTSTKSSRPGSTLMGIGFILLLIAGVLAGLIFGQGSTPKAPVWIGLAAGLLLIAAGFGRRVLAALEK